MKAELSVTSAAMAHPTGEWSAARLAIESYFDALRFHDPRLREGLITRLLDAAGERATTDPKTSPTALATRELDRLMAEWFAAVLNESVPVGDRARLSARGRLALLLNDMPARWQEEFLQPGPWSDEFVRALRESVLPARPDIHASGMQPRPIDLGAITTLVRLGNFPYFRILMIWCAFALLLVIVFRMTH